MKLHQKQTAMAACIAMVVMILDGKCALQGAAQGVELCLKTVVPSLFPFLFFSSLLTSSLMGLPLPLLRPAGKLLGVPEGAESVLIAGFLGGYPAGAQQIALAYGNKSLDKNSAEGLLAVCCNAGPSFLFGMIAPRFPVLWMAWALWGVHILSAFLTAAVLGVHQPPSARLPEKELSVSTSLRESITAMGIICGWILLFRIAMGFLERWFGWLLPEEILVILTGFLELSNGCCALERILSPDLRFVACAGMLSFGGLCVALQTASVTKGLSLKGYFRGKLLQTLFSVLLSAPMVHKMGWIGTLAAVFLAFVPRLRKKSSSQGAVCGV